ncbi:hypothetical protein [Kribbella sp. HUAS MG21]|uniref:DUF4254 domain-containing protein n=1 Tax=Kribbella sp. HUAS MG21 TaxID=3160966 RepID=A0AAU7THT0_9ACTN
MTSRGIGDAQRVLGQPRSWVEQTFPKPTPALPDAAGDTLLGFVCSQVRQWETQVATEAAEYRNQVLGAAMVRYALDIRRQCAALRRILARYGDARDAGEPEAVRMREFIADVATAWSAHPDWRDDWPT